MGQPGLWRHRFTLMTALLWTMIPAAIAVALAPGIQDQQLRGVVYTGAGGLFFGGFLGGMLKVLLDEVVAYKRQREDAAQFVTNVLADLKSVYDRVGRAQLLIPAHKSVKTYGAEMRDLIEAQVQLRNVVRALNRRPDGLDQDARAEIVTQVRRMESYLKQLSLEFRDNYRRLADETPHAAEGLSQLAVLSDLVSEGQEFRESFEVPLDSASELLRRQLARILRSAA